MTNLSNIDEVGILGMQCMYRLYGILQVHPASWYCPCITPKIICAEILNKYNLQGTTFEALKKNVPRLSSYCVLHI